MIDYSVLRESSRVAEIIDFIQQEAVRPCTIMEVCGTHTMSIARWGIKQLLPDTVKLVSGPGCPVCVTDASVMSEAFALAQIDKVIFTCFGDMLRVPAGKLSLNKLKSDGADIRIVLSPMDALELAINNKEKEVIFFAIGFETTAPLTAATINAAAAAKVNNFTVLCAHKTMPQAIRSLITGSAIDALLCPGHVAVLTGADEFAFVPQELHIPAAIAGFEPVDILLSIAYMLKDIKQGKASLHNCYPRAVATSGNKVALDLVKRIFKPVDCCWRGLGCIPLSGLTLRDEFADFDAIKKFNPQVTQINDDPRCCCGSILRGEISPDQCPLFAVKCTPDSPIGACMVSSEGSCAAFYRYSRREI